MECHSHSITILDGRSWTLYPQQCHRVSLNSFLLQQLSTSPTESARRNNIQSLSDHLKWHLWKITCTRRWRLWEWEWELKYSQSSQKSTTDIPHFPEWEFVFQSYHIPYHSWTTPRTLAPKIQKPQSCMPPFGVYQFLWREPCKNHWSALATPQYTW